MDHDPAVVEAQRLWKEGKPKEAMNLLAQRVRVLADQKPALRGSSSWMMLGCVLGVLITVIVVGVAFVILPVRLLSSDDEAMLNLKRNLERGTPFLVLSDANTPIATATLSPTATLTPTPDLYQLGMELNPISTGELIEYEQGTLRVLQVHRPFALSVYEGYTFSADYQDREAPARGTDFVGVELEFTCAPTQLTCQNPPQAELVLVLEDGRTVAFRDFYTLHAPLYEEVAGGLTTQGWRIFQVPQDAILRALIIEPYGTGKTIFADLPASQDGYLVEYPWIDFEDGASYRYAPALERKLTEAGIELAKLGVQYWKSEGEKTTALFVDILTDTYIFWEDIEVIVEADPAIMALLEAWPDYNQGVDFVALRLFSGLGLQVAGLAVKASDIESLLVGNINKNLFINRIVVQRD